MAEFPTYEEMAKEVAEKALDEFTYKDKTLREWVEIIVEQDLFAIAELEKLKAEVQGLCHTERDTFDKVVRLDKLNNAIDTRIKELKGDDNK